MEWIKNFFKNILAAINGSLITKEKTNEEISKDKDEKDKTSQKVRHKLESEIAAYIDDLIMKGAQNPFTKTPYKDFRESEGKNRSKDIDALIIRNGGNMADAYCMFGCQDILRSVEIKFNIKFDLPKTGSTQKFFNNTKPEYKTSTPDRLMIGIYQHGDEYKGHAIWCLGKQDKKQVATFEFNTSPDAGKEVIRDGQGCYFKTRNIEGYGDMRMRGFVDILKAIK